MQWSIGVFLRVWSYVVLSIKSNPTSLFLHSMWKSKFEISPFLSIVSILILSLRICHSIKCSLIWKRSQIYAKFLQLLTFFQFWITIYIIYCCCLVKSSLTHEYVFNILNRFCFGSYYVFYIDAFWKHILFYP